MRIPEIEFAEVSGGRLAYRKYGAGDVHLVVVPGLFGSGDNWHRIADAISGVAQSWCLDCRNHGESFHSNTMSYIEMANDIIEFISKFQLKNVILLGHSMGGKIAMSTALNTHPSLRHLIVVDILPKAYPQWHRPMLDLMLSVSLDKFGTRSSFGVYLTEKSGDPVMSQFLLKNVVSESGQLKWRMNLQGISDNYEAISGFPKFNGPSQVTTSFIYGEKSNYVMNQDQSEARRLFPNSTFVPIAEAGHWVQADQPTRLIDDIRLILSQP